MARPHARTPTIALAALVLCAGLARAQFGGWTVTNLHPAGTTASFAYATTGMQQAGEATVGGTAHASLWRGTAASWVDLHPAGATHSFACTTTGTQQAGYAMFGGEYHACLWSGTSASWVDLHPAGAFDSYAYATSGTRQVGDAHDGLRFRASLWNGRAASWEDLSLSLAGSWEHTHACGIWADANTLYVAGWGYNSTTNRAEALLWTRPIVPALPRRPRQRRQFRQRRVPRQRRHHR